MNTRLDIASWDLFRQGNQEDRGTMRCCNQVMDYSVFTPGFKKYPRITPKDSCSDPANYVRFMFQNAALRYLQ